MTNGGLKMKVGRIFFCEEDPVKISEIGW